MKAAVLSIARSLGYDIYRIDRGSSGGAQSEVVSLRNKLHFSETMRQIHQRDTLEIEELLRLIALPDLPKRDGREKQLADLIGTNVSEGLYLVDAIHKALKVPGDICEFGVAQGATSKLIASEILNTGRTFWLFDSFEGLPPPHEKDKLIDDIFGLGDMSKYTGQMASPESEVLSRLDEVQFPRERLRVMKGWVKQSLARPDAPKQVAFAYVDFDFYEPIKDALIYLDAHSVPGARIMVDDYGFFSEGAQLATDEFVAASDGRWHLEKPIAMAGHFVVLTKTA